MERFYCKHSIEYCSGAHNGVLIVEVFSIQRSLDTLRYYTGTENGVLITEVSSIRRFVWRGSTVKVKIKTHSILKVIWLLRHTTLHSHKWRTNGHGIA